MWSRSSSMHPRSRRARTALSAGPAPQVIPYGEKHGQWGELRLPAHPGPHPLAVLVHGGFWLDAWELDTLDGLAVDLTARGWATWDVEYRRGGGGGGGGGPA